jgi:N-acetylmuramoyl-L-alanine amidase
MPNSGCVRRRVLGAIVCCAIARWALDSVSARAAARAAPPVRRVPTVVIDPGHGGVDPGAISANGVYEKDIVLATARELARQLAATRRFRVVLTRSTDEFLPLRERVARARAWKADLFLSIHADALPERELRGLAVFTQSLQASDREAAALANGENRADLVAGINLSRQPREVGNVLLDLTRRETSNLSVAFARRITAELAREAVLRDRAFGRFRRADGTGHSLRTRRARLSLQPRRGASATAARLSAKARARPRARGRGLFRHLWRKLIEPVDHINSFAPAEFTGKTPYRAQKSPMRRLEFHVGSMPCGPIPLHRRTAEFNRSSSGIIPQNRGTAAELPRRPWSEGRRMTWRLISAQGCRNIIPIYLPWYQHHAS